MTYTSMKSNYREGTKEDCGRIAQLDNIASDGAIEYLFHDSYFLDALCVDEDFRGMGIGSKLIELTKIKAL